VYSISDKNIFIIHQRSPCVIGLSKKYCEELVEILGTLDAEQVIILTGAETDDIEIMNR
jgi:predicted ATP-grasp superfamily ATP-dependent carboligase